MPVISAGDNEVLQHKVLDITETAHETTHPDGAVNLRIKRSKMAIEAAVRNNLSGYTPEPSPRVKNLLLKCDLK